jgi:hypothetical protein
LESEEHINQFTVAQKSAEDVVVGKQRPVKKQIVDDPDIVSKSTSQSKFKESEEAGIVMTPQEATEYRRRTKRWCGKCSTEYGREGYQ